MTFKNLPKEVGIFGKTFRTVLDRNLQLYNTDYKIAQMYLQIFLEQQFTITQID